MLFFQLGGIVPRCGVREYQKIKVFQMFPHIFPVGAGHGGDPKIRNKFVRLPVPVAYQTGGADHHGGIILFCQPGGKKGQKLDGFPQPHFIGKDHIEKVIRHLAEPLHAFRLIFPQFACKTERRFRFRLFLMAFLFRQFRRAGIRQTGSQVPEIMHGIER